MRAIPREVNDSIVRDVEDQVSFHPVETAMASLSESARSFQIYEWCNTPAPVSDHRVKV